MSNPTDQELERSITDRVLHVIFEKAADNKWQYFIPVSEKITGKNIHYVSSINRYTRKDNAKRASTDLAKRLGYDKVVEFKN